MLKLMVMFTFSILDWKYSFGKIGHIRFCLRWFNLMSSFWVNKFFIFTWINFLLIKNKLINFDWTVNPFYSDVIFPYHVFWGISIPRFPRYFHTTFSGVFPYHVFRGISIPRFLGYKMWHWIQMSDNLIASASKSVSPFFYFLALNWEIKQWIFHG